MGGRTCLPPMQTDWRPIAEAQSIRMGTHAELRMESGRIYRAVWRQQGRAVAWIMDPGQARKRPCALYTPTHFRVLAVGASFDNGTPEGRRREAMRGRGDGRAQQN